METKSRELTTYLPLFYLENVKRPGKKYFLTHVIYTDLAISLLSLVWLQPRPLVQASGVFFLLLSFWCVYEIGYYENDTIAEKYEVQPMLSTNYEQYKSNFRPWRAWIWSALLSLSGLYLLKSSSTGSWTIESEILIDTLKWCIFLGVLRLTFLAYNYLDKKTRIWLYPILQIQKYFGYLIFIPINPIGVNLFVAQVLSSSTSYLVYRRSESWPNDLPLHFIRLLLFIFLMFASSLGVQDYSAILSWQTAVILIYCFFRARREIASLFSTAYVISCDKANSQ